MTDAVEYNRRQGYRPELWQRIQKVIGVVDDGVPGPLTAQAVEVWQSAEGLEPDGKVGPRTLDRLRAHFDPGETPVMIRGYRRVRCTPTRSGHGYDRTTVRTDVADRLEKVRDELEDVGAVLTSAGGLRKLDAGSKPGRASLSLHHLGLAHDLATYSGAQDPGNPDTDPYLVSRTRRSDGRYDWHVWARCEGGTMRTIMAVYDGVREKPVNARVISLTAIAERHGLYPIGSRSCYPDRYGCAEWWHLEARDLCEGKTFGELLLAVWPMAEVNASRFARDGQLSATWRGGYFR